MDYLGTADYLTSPMTEKVESWTHYNEWGEITHNAVLKCGQRELDLVKRYATHDYDSVLSMYYAKARFYDAQNRRFDSTDQILDGSVYDITDYAKDPVQLIQYLYVNNNPVIYIDPDGLRPVIDDLDLFASYEEKDYDPVGMPSVYDRYIEEQLGVSYMDALVWSFKQEQMEAEKLAKLIDDQGWERYEGKTDDEIYYLNMSPMTDGINSGMYQSEDLIDRYPRQEHKRLYQKGVRTSGAIQMYVFAFVSVADYYKSPPKCVNKAKIIDELNSSSAEGTSNANPLENIKFTDKVKAQMKQGDYHSFPGSVEGFGANGEGSLR
ncbi:MAG: RHS repeat-associated core domain-containing protein [Sedimentibacter sp.]|uniref:RHS repeat domain-containing protein n=1 Tax=Sedimentibacter sp. TaxID=1960295 RepID=UPI00315925A1